MEFLIGMIFGVAGVIVLGLTGAAIWLTSLLSTKKKYSKVEIQKIVKDAQTVGSVAYRYTIIEEIMNRQLELTAQLEAPTKGTSHSFWKRDIQDQIMDMEEEKMDIFRSILSDGLDPIFTIIGVDGGKENIKMSVAIQRYETHNDRVPSVSSSRTKTESNKSCKNESNLIPLFKSKENSNDKSSDPEADKP